MDNCQKFNEASLPEKEAFYSHLKMKYITDEDYMHAKRIRKDFKIFKIKSLGEFHGLYVQSDTLLLADIFNSFWNMCLEIYELDHAHFPFAQGLAWQVVLKR